MRNSAWLVLLASLATAACSAGESEGAESAGIDRDTLTRRQKDSIIAESPLPGAGAVGRALDAADASGDRNARMDSMMRR